MGTRSLTVLCDENDNEICVLYRQFDGYPEGHGLELAEFLAPFTIVNGIQFDETRKVANGMNCLAGLVVSHFKGSEAGNFYLYPAGSRDHWEEYIYTVRLLNDQIYIFCQNAGGVTIFGGPPEQFLEQYGAEQVDTDHCQYCGRNFNHPNHAVNHYAKHHKVSV